MKNNIDVKLVLDIKCIEPEVTIKARRRNEQVESIIDAIEKVSKSTSPTIVAYNEDVAMRLAQRDIIRIYSQGHIVTAQTKEGEYRIKNTLSGTEKNLNPDRFMRISQSEIININKVKCFDINHVGTIGIEFDNGVTCFASRNYVKKIKNLLLKNN